MQTKICSRCGVEKPVEAFRPYYGNRKGHYKFCRECERIEERRKYLCRKSDLTAQQLDELRKIEKLYELRTADGLDVPGKAAHKNPSVESLVDSQLEAFRGDKNEEM